MSLLPSHYKKELHALDSAFANIISAHFALPYTRFYEPNAHNTQMIANTFEIDIQDEHPSIAREILDKPILKKSKLGTYNGIREVIEPIFGAIDIQTHATDENLEPYSFTIQIEPSSNNIADLKKAQELINAYKPLRDSSQGISINFPQAQIPIECATSGHFRISLDSNTRLKRSFEATSAHIGKACVMWQLSF